MRETLRFNPQHANYYYEADSHGCGEDVYKKLGDRPENRLRFPSMFMPRIACRIMLEITDVRIEHLQAITEADARAEGCTADQDPFWTPTPADPDSGGFPSARNSFEYLWHEINGAKTWMENPWVWVVSFKRVTV